MTSLRNRLTLLYASVLGLVLVVVAVVITRLVFGFMMQSTTNAVTESVQTARGIIARNPYAGGDALQRLMQTEASVPGVVVFSRGDKPPPPRGDRLMMLQLWAGRLLGLNPRIVHLAQHEPVLIAPDLQTIKPQIRFALALLAVSVLIALALAWMIARWITAQAIAPLIAVTGELRRFAQGDFTQRPVTTADRSELGDLIAAYNGATAQVAAAFAERVRLEEQMRRFIADAGHELRTPLTVISGFLDVLERGGIHDTGIRERALPTLRIETRRMRRLVERLMALARLERPEKTTPESVDVAEIARDAVAAVCAARSTEVEMNVTGAHTRVLGDRADLHDAIANLVDNAVKYGGGTPVSVDVRDDAERVVVRVRDRGPGIAEADRPHLFERFFRGDNAPHAEGSGLGLAIVERAVERCGGTVRLEDGAPGRTTFALALPTIHAHDDGSRVYPIVL